jgi:predicted TIM-barrel fold metal-dependent hydrolase
MEAAGRRTTDTHAHVFTRACKLHENRRYTPEGEAPLEDFLQILDDNGIAQAVLVQPSFLGTDNSYLMDCLGRESKRLRGVVVVSPDVSDLQLTDMDAAGVVGIRINMFDSDAPSDLSGPDWQGLIRRVAALGWHVEVHTEGSLVADRLNELLPTDATIVLDHFGRPDPRLGVRSLGFKALLRALDTGRVWIKASGPYRCGGGDCSLYARAILDAAGNERLVWGSDWPWTQFSDGITYGKCFDWLRSWVPDPKVREVVLGPAAAKLFKFD